MASSRNRFREHHIQQAVQAMRAATRRPTPAAPAAPAGPSRRRFLQAGMAGALAAGLPLLSACGSDDGGSNCAGFRETDFLYRISYR